MSRRQSHTCQLVQEKRIPVNVNQPAESAEHQTQDDVKIRVCFINCALGVVYFFFFIYIHN